MTEPATVIEYYQYIDELIIICLCAGGLFLLLAFIFLGKVSDAVHKATHHDTDFDPCRDGKSIAQVDREWKEQTTVRAIHESPQHSGTKTQ